MERRPPRGPFSRQPIVYLADGAPRLANEIRHMRQACAPKPIAPAIFPPANSIYRKKLPPACPATTRGRNGARSEEHTSELQSLMRISYAVFCLKKKTYTITPEKPTLTWTAIQRSHTQKSDQNKLM